MKLKFTGTEADFGNVKLNRFGQEFDVAATDLKDLILGAGPGAAFAGAVNALPSDQFDALGFSEKDLAAIGEPGPREYATGETAARIRRTHEATAKYRETLLKPHSAHKEKK